MERERTALAKATRALVYPAFILLAAVGVIGIMMTVVLPSLMETFTQVDAELPLTTKLLIALSGFLSSYKFNLLGVGLGITLLLFWYIRRPAGRRNLDRLLVRLPFIGRINLLREMSHFSRTTSMMLKAGVPMTEIMNMVVQMARNGVLRDALDEVRREMVKGQGLYRPMAANELFPRLLVQIVRVGEEAGTLSDDLAVVTEFYTQEIDERISSLLTLMEPCIFLVLGLVVAFIAVSVIMPIYTVMGAVG